MHAQNYRLRLQKMFVIKKEYKNHIIKMFVPVKQISLVILLTTAGFILGTSFALNCSNVVSQEREGSGLSYLARINWTVPVSTGPSGWTLTLFFDQDFVGVGVWQGFVTMNGTDRWAEIRNRNKADAQLKRGEQRSMRFRVNYGFDIPKPQVVSLRFQDVELCN